MKKVLAVLIWSFLTLYFNNDVFAQKVLYFRDYSVGVDRMQEALDNLSIDYTLTTDNSYFQAELSQVGKYDIAIYFAQNYGPDVTSVTMLADFIAAGGKGIYDDWTQNNTLSSLFGANYSGIRNLTSTHILTPELQLGLPSNPFSISNTGWGTFSTGMNAAAGYTVDGVFPNGDASIISNSSRTSYIIGFLGDTPPFYHLYKSILLTLRHSISTSIAFTTLCQSSTISVNFIALGSYSLINTFTAQLSDASGSFASPVNIGTLSATGSGTINATIPANTPAGTGYRIRVVSSDPAVISSDNGSDIKINALPTATLSGFGVVNPGGSANLSAVLTGTGPWSVTYTDGTNPVTIDNITASPHTISVSPASTTTYSLVSASDANCDATSLSGTAQVIVNAINTNSLAKSSFCTGESLKVTFSTIGNLGSESTYTVQLSGASGSFASPISIGSVSGDESGTINATIPASTPAGTGYRIRVVSSNPVVIGTDNGSNITINASPVVSVPTIAPVSNAAGTCGASVSFAATATGTTPTITYAIGSTAITSPHTFPVGTTTVTATATNSCGTDSKTFAVTVSNNAPVLGAIVPSTVNPVQINTTFTASASFTDNNLQSAIWNWEDGTSAGTISGTTITGSRIYKTPGVYTIKLTATDACGSATTAEYQYVVVYDPSGGFVTGGGWINSPQNTELQYMQQSGRANFGFVSKYQKGATVPSGETNFEFQTAGLSFQSTSYDWLVVASYKAQYKGSGTINGSSGYGFLLSAVDGQVTGGGGADKFRIKIWHKATNTVVYDNQGGADDAEATSVIAGGSIVVHEAKKTTSTSTSSKMVATGSVAEEPRSANFYSYPTAFSDRAIIGFSVEQEEDFALEVFDMRGALVKKLASGRAEANKLYEFELRGEGMAEGMYITRLSTTSRVQSLKAVLKR